MFERYLDQQNKLRLPLSGNLYFVDISGNITDNCGNMINNFYNQNNDLCVDIAWVDGYKTYRVAELVAFTFKPVFIPHTEWNRIWVIFRDGDNKNLHPSNLVWKFPTTGIESKRYPGYYYIPCFTKYVVDKFGNVMNVIQGYPMTGTKKDVGYVYYNLTPDIKSKDIKKSYVIGRHRILSFVFLDYPKDVDVLEVNHINGIPGYDRLENLEWVTRQENIKHAFINNLRTDNKPVIVTNHNTGEVTKYYSAHECGRVLGLGRAVVHWRIKKSPGKIFKPGYSFKYENDDYQKADDSHYGVKIKLINTVTNDILFFDSIYQCSIFMKVSKKVIQKRLKRSNTGQYKEYVFERIN